MPRERSCAAATIGCADQNLSQVSRGFTPFGLSHCATWTLVLFTRGGTQRGRRILGRAGGSPACGITTDSKGAGDAGAHDFASCCRSARARERRALMKRLLAMTTATIVLGLGSAALAATNLPGGLDYPVCDRAHSDQCLQLGQNASVDRQLL